MVVRLPSVDAMRIEPVTLDDLPAIAAIELSSFSDPWSEDAFRQLLREPHVFFVCARDRMTGSTTEALDAGTRLVGYVVAWFVADEGEIANLAVGADGRGRGVGGALLDAALEYGRERGTTAVYLEVRESNIPARRLYSSRGFVEVGRRTKYYRRPVEDAVILRKSITSGEPATRCSA